MSNGNMDFGMLYASGWWSFDWTLIRFWIFFIYSITIFLLIEKEDCSGCDCLNYHVVHLKYMNDLLFATRKLKKKGIDSIKEFFFLWYSNTNIKYYFCWVARVFLLYIYMANCLKKSSLLILTFIFIYLFIIFLNCIYLDLLDDI